MPANPSIYLKNWPWPVKVFTLGRFEIQRDDQAIVFNGKTQLMPLRLLKLIIALGGNDIPEEHLSDILWPETDGYAAHRSFSTTIYRLRQLLDIPHLIKIADGKVTLNRGLCFVDAWAYTHSTQKLLGCQDNFPQLLNSPRNRSDLEKALSRYRGSFLTSDDWGAPIIAERERLRDIYIKLIREVGNYLEKNNQWSDAIWYYKLGLAVDEFAELFYQRLMICYMNEGQPSEAMNIYERCQKILKLSFGLEPSQKTKEIRLTLKNRSL
jgi:two-component SAPR family response regulator